MRCKTKTYVAGWRPWQRYCVAWFCRVKAVILYARNRLMWSQEELTSEVRERNGLCGAVFRIENAKLVFTDSSTILCMACVAVICGNRNKMKFFLFRFVCFSQLVILSLLKN